MTFNSFTLILVVEYNLEPWALVKTRSFLDLKDITDTCIQLEAQDFFGEASKI